MDQHTEPPAEDDGPPEPGASGLAPGAEAPRPAAGRFGLGQRIGFVLGLALFVGMLAAPTPRGMSPQAQRAAAVALLMATWWISQAIPIPAVALLPLVLFPTLRVMDAKASAAPYADHNIYLFMGGFFIAMAMQKWGLHRRVALHVIRILGTNPRLIILGFMVATAGISLWISDTATTMMMMPIAMAVISHALGPQGALRPSSEVRGPRTNFAAALVLCVAYASAIGGIGTLVGTPPNIVFKGAVAAQFPAAPEIAFSQWMMVGMPVAAIFLPLCWLWMTRVAIPVGAERIPGGREVIHEELARLGPMNRGEQLTLAIFAATVLAWLFRANIQVGSVTIPGWANALGVEKWVTDSTVAIAAGLLLFLLPVDLSRGEFVLDWQSALRLPWGVLILFGGGFALAASFEATGLSEWIGGVLSHLQGTPPLVMIACTCTLVTLLSEVASNTATATIMMPVLGATAVSMGIHPFMLMMPAAMAASCGFMLPVGTPPNAIAFGTGYVTMPQMVRAGIGLDLIGITVITIMSYVITIPVFSIALQGLPTWAR